MVEDVEFSEIEDGVVIDEMGVFEDYKIEPSASTSSTSRYTEFLSDFLQMYSDVLSVSPIVSVTLRSSYREEDVR